MPIRAALIGAGFAGAVLAGAVLAGCTEARSDPVRVVGSSTIFPFAARVAEHYSDESGVAMVVEQTGSGGGHKLFCSGDPSIDATTSSRRQKPSESDLCRQNGVTDSVELKLGYDGIVVARVADAQGLPDALTQRDLYFALAREIPVSPTDCRLQDNPNRLWSDVNPDLPDRPILVYGPPPTSGTRDAFVETAMEAGARSVPCLRAMERASPNLFRARAQTLREDGLWVDAGENDAALVRTLERTPGALGVFGFSFLDQSGGRLSGLSIDGVAPGADTIISGDYPVVRDLYLYVHADGGADLAGYARAFLSEDAAGPGGYLEEIGLIPLPAALRARMRARIPAEAGS